MSSGHENVKALTMCVLSFIIIFVITCSIVCHVYGRIWYKMQKIQILGQQVCTYMYCITFWFTQLHGCKIRWFYRNSGFVIGCSCYSYMSLIISVLHVLPLIHSSIFIWYHKSFKLLTIHADRLIKLYFIHILIDKRQLIWWTWRNWYLYKY